MKIKIFDVVELKNKNKATILENKSNDTYKAEIIDLHGKSLGTEYIYEDDISKIIFSKYK